MSIPTSQEVAGEIKLLPEVSEPS